MYDPTPYPYRNSNNPLDKISYEAKHEIIECDDKERFLPLLSEYGDTVETMYAFLFCAHDHAKKCLIAMIEGEVCAPAYQIYARLAPDHNPLIQTPLACVASLFPEADDIIDLLLKRGPLHHADIKCQMIFSVLESRTTCPLDQKPNLKCARLLAPHTDGINDIAWSFLKEGKLVPLAALLLVAQEKVLVPFDSGLTIRERIMDMVEKLSTEGDLDHEGAMYHSMLIEAYKLFDIFERAGAALSLYCSSMHEHAPPHKVLIDVASVLKKAGYALEPRDHDLRDCYRDCPEVKKATMYKLSDPGSPNSKYRLPSSLTRVHGVSTTVSSYPYPGYCQLLHKLKSSPVVNLKPSASEPQLLRLAAGQVENGGSGITRKHLASIASRLKTRVKF
ncbi:hypothetical protein KSS87_007243 [Heliosperma pusillum]|nr:hypothetical protein KSS87_007243 [Heliosperma pusillum]